MTAGLPLEAIDAFIGVEEGADRVDETGQVVVAGDRAVGDEALAHAREARDPQGSEARDLGVGDLRGGAEAVVVEAEELLRDRDLGGAEGLGHARDPLTSDSPVLDGTRDPRPVPDRCRGRDLDDRNPVLDTSGGKREPR